MKQCVFCEGKFVKTEMNQVNVGCAYVKTNKIWVCKQCFGDTGKPAKPRCDCCNDKG